MLNRPTFVFLVTALLMLVLSVPAAADQPTEIPFSVTFVDVNPCTGLDHMVTISGTTFLVVDRDGRIVGWSERTITTDPTGFVGRGTDTFVLNGETLTVRLRDILTNDAGERIGARFVIVVDLSSGDVRAVSGEVVCIP